MVLPAPPADPQSGPSAVAPWVERIAKLLRLVERGILVLVDHANDAQLGPLVRALCAEHPDLQVLTEAARIEEAPHGAVIILATRIEDAVWLNLARPIFSERALRVVLWSKTETTAELARRAPDFFDWIGRRLECPPGPPAFAVAGLRAALRARAWAVAFLGKALGDVFAAALPRRALIRADAGLPDDTLFATAKAAGPAWIVWSNVLDERGVARVRRIATGAGRRGRNLLDNPRGDAPEAWPVSEVTADLGNAARTLESAGAPSAGRLAALLDLEPEAIALAAELLRGGTAASEIEQAVLGAADPGAAVGRLAGERGELDPVLVAGYLVPAPLLRAFASDPRVRKASAVLAGSARTALPPLTERIAPGAAGAAEFERLMMQLLAIYAGSRRLVRTGGVDDGGFDVAAPDGLPGVDGGVAIHLDWPGGASSDIESMLQRASSYRDRTPWILITPIDLPPSERERVRSHPSRLGRGVYCWGQTQIEQLLRKCPALLARYYPEEARAYLPGYDGTDFGTLTTRYREKVALVYDRLKTIGIPPEVRPRESRIELPLAELFIPLRLVPEKRGAASMDLAHALAADGSAVVLADPGMGKSTLLAYLALVFAGGVALEGVVSPPRLVPLHISLRDFVRRQKQRPGLSFLDYLQIEAQERLSLPSAHPAFFEAALRMGEAVVLFDGLDEVGNESARHTIAASIRTFQAEYPDCRFWITSRIYGYTDNVRLPISFAHYRIEPLDDAQIDDFVGRWYAHQITASPQEALDQADSLRAAVRRTPSVRRLAGNPLLLTLMAFIHHGLRRLPRDRGELYEKCIEMLLKTWQGGKLADGEAARSMAGLTLDVPTQQDYLAHLAFFAQQKNQGGKDEEARGLLSRRDAVDALAARHFTRARRERPAITEIVARDEMGRFLDYICDETGLLLDRGNEQIAFIHLSFQEYLAAWVFLCDGEMAHGPGFFVEHLGDPAWEEVLLLRLYIVLREGGGVTRFDEILAAVLRSLERKSAPQGWLTLARALRDDLEFSDRDRKEILGRVLGFWLEEPAFEGTWYSALEEVKLFAERVRAILRGVIAEAREHARKPADVIALLHLETKLFTFPENAAETLRRRADLAELLADLVPFAELPAMRTLLAEKAKVTDWVRTLRVLDGPETYRRTVRWMTEPPAAAAAEAATALLWDKIFTDLRSRAAFAEPRRGHADAAIFDLPGALTFKGPLSSATLPYALLRTLQASLPAAVSVSAASLLCASLAKMRQQDARATDLWSELTSWTAGWIASQLDRFPAAVPFDRDAISGLAAFFIDFFVGDFGRTFDRTFGRAYVRSLVSDFRRSFGRSFVHSFVRSFVGDFGRDFGRSFVRDFGRSFVSDFGRSFVGTFVRDFARDFGRHSVGDFGRDFVHSIVRDFGLDPDNPDWEEVWNRAMEDETQQLRLLGHKDFWWMAILSGTNDLGFCKNVTALHTDMGNPLALPLLLTNIWNAAVDHMLLAACRHAGAAYPNEPPPDDALETWLQHNPLVVYATALAWQEHCKALEKVSGPTASLAIAHAAYASLMTGLPCTLPFTPDLTDPRVRVSFLLYELCNFRDAEANVRKLEQEIASPAAELRPLLEAAGLIAAAADGDKPSTHPGRVEPSREPMPEPELPTLFSWLHLSDIHVGHRDTGHRWDQKLVLDALHRDIAAHAKHAIPSPGAILLTGDIAFSGRPEQYAEAQAWLDTIASTLAVAPDRVFLVPGNHDIDRNVDRESRNSARLVRGLREGADRLDDVLSNPDDRALLTSRLAAYLRFASPYASLQTPDPLFWSHAFTTPGGLPIRLIGLSTPLLSAGDVDHGKLRLGNAALAATLTGADRTREVVFVLTHHPLRGGWLADQRDADRWLQSRAHVHLFGHVHEADSEDARSGAGAGLIRIAAGAAHGDLLPPDVPASHGYSIGAVVAAADGSLRLRIWPRRWSDQNKDFRTDVNNVPEGRLFAEHTLSGLRLPARAGG